jgi:hypothetical protein
MSYKPKRAPEQYGLVKLIAFSQFFKTGCIHDKNYLGLDFNFANYSSLG